MTKKIPTVDKISTMDNNKIKLKNMLKKYCSARPYSPFFLHGH